jgi:hypothetical protein
MRWTLAATVCTALALAGAQLAAAGVKPVLKVGAGNALRGSHFRAHELVHVVFTSDVRQVRVLRVSAAGSFAAVLPTTDSCSSLRIRVTGSSGDVAAIAVAKGLCPPPSSTGAQTAGTTAPGGGDTTPPATGGTQTLPDPHGPPTIDPNG